jgi:hypothetical protein
LEVLSCRLPPACNQKKKKKRLLKICYAFEVLSCRLPPAASMQHQKKKKKKLQKYAMPLPVNQERKKKKKKKGFEPLNFSAAANVQLEREKKRNC